MRSPRKLTAEQATYFLKRARRAIKTNPTLKGAVCDPETIKAADFVIKTMQANGVLPTGFNTMQHFVQAGKPEPEAAILAAIVERRLRGTKGARP